jgi:hypothetical protein
MNGDGRAEYLWVDENGAVTAFLNLGSPSGEESYDGAQVQWLPQGVIATGVGAARQEVQFAVRLSLFSFCKSTDCLTRT